MSAQKYWQSFEKIGFFFNRQQRFQKSKFLPSLKAPLIQEYFANRCSFKNIMLFQEHYVPSRTLCSFKNILLVFFHSLKAPLIHEYHANIMLIQEYFAKSALSRKFCLKVLFKSRISYFLEFFPKHFVQSTVKNLKLMKFSC